MEGSIREMAEREDEEGQGELFPDGVFQGDELSLTALVKKGASKVSATVSMRSAEFPSPAGGLLAPSRKGTAVVTYEYEKPELVPVWEDKPRDEDRDITGWKVRQIIRPIHIAKVSGEEDVIEANFALLMDGDPTRAAALLERLQAVATEHLGAAVE